MKPFTEASKMETMSFNARTTEEVISALKTELPPCIHDDYFSFLKFQNGGSGFVGEEYLILFRAEEISGFNLDYEVEEYAPGMILFGSNGGGEAYAFDTTEPGCPVVKIPFIGIDRSYAISVGSSFSNFIQCLYDRP